VAICKHIGKNEFEIEYFGGHYISNLRKKKPYFIGEFADMKV
jgi:hypothetical protein